MRITDEKGNTYTEALAAAAFTICVLWGLAKCVVLLSQFCESIGLFK